MDEMDPIKRSILEEELAERQQRTESSPELPEPPADPPTQNKLEGKFERLLRIFDLKGKRARVYLACLELGSSTVTPIAKRAGIIRTTTYDILEDLQIRGLIIYHEVNNRHYYQVADPRRLKQILIQQQKEVDASLPELLALYKPSKEKPVAKMYEGAEISKIYEELLEAPYIYAYGSLAKIDKYYPNYPKFAKKVFKLPIRIRELTERNPTAESYQSLYVPPRHELRFMPEGMQFETDNVIYGDKVAMISYGETVHGLVVESKAIVETQKQLFEYLWKLAE